MKSLFKKNRTKSTSTSFQILSKTTRVSCLLIAAMSLAVNAAEVTLSGFDNVVQGKIYAQVLVDEPVSQVRMEIPGIVKRIERSAPYGLMSDHNGKLNPWDTTAFANGDYILTVVATLKDGREITEHFPFKIANPLPQSQTQDITIGISKLPSQIYGGQKLTLATTGLADGEVVWFHLFDKKWGNLIRDSLEVRDQSVTLTVPHVTGTRRLQLQYKDQFKSTRTVEVLPAIVIPIEQPASEEDPLQANEGSLDSVSNPATDLDVAGPLPQAGQTNDLNQPLAAPEPTLISIDTSTIPAELTVGQRLTIPVSGIASGEEVFVHLFDRQWGDLVNFNAIVADGDISIVMPSKTGERILQLQYSSEYKVNKNIILRATQEPVAPDSDTSDLSDPQVDTKLLGGTTLEPTVNSEAEISLEPIVISIELSAIPSVLQVGQRVSVPVSGINDGESVFFHVFDSQWGDLVRSSVTVKDGMLDLAIPSVSGERILQIQYQNAYKISKRVSVITNQTATGDLSTPTTSDRVDIPVVSNEDITPDLDKEASNTPDQNPPLANEATTQADLGDNTQSVAPATPPVATSSTTPTLIPGAGWSSSTIEPGSVGDPKHPGYPHYAIARWAVVPHQAFAGNFTIGVAAFHSYGIDRVEFSVNNGPWASASEMLTNPRTRADEYFVNLDASKIPDGKVTVRAIAYPKIGRPRLLDDLVLFANSNGTLKFPVIELGAGTHNLSGLSASTPKDQGWLTIRPKPGVKKEECIITGIDRVSGGGRLKIQGVTFKAKGGMDMLYGLRDENSWVWLDNVSVIGNGRTDMTAWLVHLWGRQFYTDCDITKVRSVFNGGGGLLFARNIVIRDIYEDVFRAFGYVANVTIDGVDRGDSDHHPDVFEFATGWTQQQIIFHNVVAREAYSQGMAGGNMRDVAMINCDIETPGWSALQVGREMVNVLIQDSRFRGGARLRDALPDGVVIRDSSLGWQAPFLPENWSQPGVTVLPLPPMYD